MTTFWRYVAIGDSTTEGLHDPDDQGCHRGFADRLAQHIADGQDEPLEYANLAIRGLKMREIRTSQLDDALAMEPDLLTIFGGIKDVIGPRCDFDAIRADYVIVFGEARRTGCTVLTWTMPDPAINPLGAQLRERVNRLNAIIRSEAATRGVLVMDFEAYPVATDRRLWFDDRWHCNSLGHLKIAEALAWRLGVAGFDESWADPLEGEPAPPRPRIPIAGDVDWAVHYLAPWVSQGIRRLPAGLGIDRKRPVQTVVPPSRQRVD